MFERIIRFCIEQRWLVLLAVAGMAAIGVYSYTRLPIDAVVDISNVQVVVNTEAPGYSPLETEQRVTWPIETVMAGLPGLEETRSLSRYGLSQVTVIFKDGTDIYFARQLVNQRVQEARDRLPAGVAASMGPISTGLGENQDAALLVSADAVQTIDNQPMVFKAVPEGFEATPLKLGRGDGRAVEVLGGLQAGDKVVSKNAFVLKSELGKASAGHEH